MSELTVPSQAAAVTTQLIQLPVERPETVSAGDWVEIEDLVTKLNVILRGVADPRLGPTLVRRIISSRATKARNSTAALISDLKSLSPIFRAANLLLVPARPAALAQYIDKFAADQRPERPSTVKRKLSSVATLHRLAGLASPTEHPMVKDALTRHARKLGTRPMQVQGFRSEDVAKILAAFGSQSSLADLRDRAMILVAHDAALRSAELLALTVEDLDQAKEGRGVILIRKSKTDQTGQGSEQLISPAAMAAIQAWLGEAGIEEGPIFRSLERDGVTLRDKAMSRVGYYKMIQARAAAVGLAGSTHSFRVGFGQDMWAKGANPLQAMKVGRWKDPATYNRYGERAEVELSIASERFLSKFSPIS